MTARGQLRVYLGAAPGVGKTYKMLEEGHRRQRPRHRRRRRLVETHGRRAHRGAARPAWRSCPASTIDLPRDARSPRWTSTPSSPAARRSPWSTSWPTPTCPAAATPSAGRTSRSCSTPASPSSPRSTSSTWSRSTTSSQQITGVPQRETVPDEVVRRADQIELVDMTPEALRRRMAHGNVYQPEKVDAALGNYFRVGNLTALRELALLWLADKVDEQLDRYRAEHHIAATWEARERVVVALTGGPEGDTLIRRAARIAARTKGADLLAVHVARSDGLAGGRPRPPGPPARAGREPRRHLPPGRRRRHPDRAARLRPRRQRHPARARRQPPRPARPDLLAAASASPPPPSPARSTSTWSPTSRSTAAGAALAPGPRRSPRAGGSPASSLAAVGLPLLTARR